MSSEPESELKPANFPRSESQAGPNLLRLYIPGAETVHFVRSRCRAAQKLSSELELEPELFDFPKPIQDPAQSHTCSEYWIGTGTFCSEPEPKLSKHFLGTETKEIFGQIFGFQKIRFRKFSVIFVNLFLKKNYPVSWSCFLATCYNAICAIIRDYCEKPIGAHKTMTQEIRNLTGQNIRKSRCIFIIRFSKFQCKCSSAHKNK